MKPIALGTLLAVTCVLAVSSEIFQRPAPELDQVPLLTSIDAGSGGALPSLSRDGGLVAFRSAGLVEVRSAQTGELIAQLRDAHSAIFPGSGRYLAVAKTRRLDLYSVGAWIEPEVIVRLEGLDSSTFTTAYAVSPDDGLLWIGLRRLAGSTVEAWMVQCPLEEATPRIGCPASPKDGISMPSTVSALEFSPEGGQLAIAHGLQTELRDANTGDLLAGPLIHQSQPGERQSTTTALAFSPDGGLLVCSRYSDAPLIWDLRTKTAIQLPRTGDGLHHSSSAGEKAGFSFDGLFLFSVDGQSVAVWRTVDWRLLQILQREGATCDALTVSGDGQTAALRLSRVQLDPEAPEMVVENKILTIRTRDLVLSQSQ